jgi:putative hydrolase of the HAD superfamily
MAPVPAPTGPTATTAPAPGAEPAAPARPTRAAGPAGPAGPAATATWGLDGVDPTAIAAVSLDVGGVLVVPDHEALSGALAAAGVAHDPARFADAHYAAMAEVDRHLSAPEEFTDYRRGFLRAAGTPDDQVDAGAAALATVLVTAVWRQPVPGAVEAARTLARAGFRLAITSNSDGTITDLLRTHGIAQVGEGPGVPVEVVTDSGVLGVAKPGAAMFHATADGLDLAPEAVLHVGDGGYYDAEGARAVGMTGVHVDPLGLCPDGRHPHVASLADLAARLTAGPAGGAAGGHRPTRAD